MIVAIGDIHGNYYELIDLLGRLSHETDYGTDTFIFLGDYVDGGPDSARVVRLLRSFQKQYPHWVFLKGNHEDMMLDALRRDSIRYLDRNQWKGQGGNATIRSYGEVYFPDATEYERAIMQEEDVILPADLDWIESLPLVHTTNNFAFVHAGFIPELPIDKNEEMDCLWIRSLFYNSDYEWEKRVVFGHTHFDIPLVRRNMIGIDTLQRMENSPAVGHLSAVVLSDEPGQKYKQRFILADFETEQDWNYHFED